MRLQWFATINKNEKQQQQCNNVKPKIELRAKERDLPTVIIYFDKVLECVPAIGF